MTTSVPAQLEDCQQGPAESHPGGAFAVPHHPTSGLPMFASLLALLTLTFAPFATNPPTYSTLPSTPLEIGEIQATQIQRYTSAVALQEGVDYVATLQAEEAAAALRSAQEAARRAQVVTPPRQSGPAPVSGACGGATNGADQFIQRESGGNPQVFNPSGAYGCYQIMPGTWHGAGCDELGAYGNASPAAQAQCASRLPMSAWNL